MKNRFIAKAKCGNARPDPNSLVFDPIIGRFISADPHIQFADNSQSYNRYSYLMNNLLSATDSSGFFLKKLAGKVKKFFKQYGRVIAAVAITALAAATGGALAAPLGGFVAGLITGRGDLRAGLIGAATAAVFVGVGSSFAALGRAAQSAGTLAQNAVVVGKIVAHGAVGGLSSVVNGGRFSDGFYSTAFTQALAGDINGIDAGNQGVSGYRIAAAAIVGGTASEISGGKFANGAVTAAFARAFNDEIPSHRNTVNTRASCPGQCTRVSLADGTSQWVPSSVAADVVAASYKGISLGQEQQPVSLQSGLDAVGTTADALMVMAPVTAPVTGVIGRGADFLSAIIQFSPRPLFPGFVGSGVTSFFSKYTNASRDFVTRIGGVTEMAVDAAPSDD